MVGFILTGHGEFAPGLGNALSLVGGVPEAFEVVKFDTDNPAEYPGLIEGAIKDMRAKTDGVVVFTDVVGGFPFQQSLAQTAVVDNVRVIGGTNLGMLIETLFSRNDTSTPDSLVETALEAGRNAIASPQLDLSGADDDFDDEDGI